MVLRHAPAEADEMTHGCVGREVSNLCALSGSNAAKDHGRIFLNGAASNHPVKVAAQPQTTS
jgi:hypothetical protein